MVDLLITLQTHSKSNSPAQTYPRYGTDDRAEITRRSVFSLIKSIHYAIANAPNPLTIRLHVLDDHSDDDIVDYIKEQLSNCKFETKFIQIEGHGLMNSIKNCYHELRTCGIELLYFAQDDYLYYDHAILEMVDEYFRFSQLVGMPVMIYPFDYPQEYFDKPRFYRIVNGAKRKWRNNPGGGSCAYLFDYETLLKNWDLYQAFCNHPLQWDLEINTINKMVSEREYQQFVPLESIALHFQGEHEKDFYVDWRPLWEASNPNV